MSNVVARCWRWWFAIPMSLRFAVGVWLALLLGVFIRVAVSTPEQQSVVPIYLLAAERMKANENLYADPPPGMDIYRNPPAVAALFVPFTYLDPKVAALLWRLVGISLYMTGVKQLVRDVLPPLSPIRRAWVWIISAVLVINAFNNGQINLPIVASALLGTAAAARGQWRIAAVWLVVTGWFKVYTAAVGLLMSVAFPRQFAARFLLLGFLFVGLSWFCVEAWAFSNSDFKSIRSHLGDFIEASQQDDRCAAPLERAPKDWTIIPRVWLDVVVPKPVSLGVSLLVAVGMAAWIWLCERGRALPPLLLGLIWLTLFGPATEMNTYSVLAPVAAVLCVVGPRQHLARLGTLLLVVAVVRGAFPSDAEFPLHSLQPIGAAILLLSLLRFGDPAPNALVDRQGEACGLSVELKPRAVNAKPDRPPDPLEF